MLSTGIILAASGIGSMVSGCWMVAHNQHQRSHYRKKIYPTHMPDLSDKYTIKYSLAPDEQISHILLRRHSSKILYELRQYPDSVYIGIDNMSLFENKNMFASNKICYSFVDHKMHNSYQFHTDKLIGSYDIMSKSETRLTYDAAITYLQSKYGRDMSNVSFSPSIYSLVTYDLKADLYFYGQNSDDGKNFIIEGIGSDTQIIDNIFPSMYYVKLSIVGLILLVLGLFFIEHAHDSHMNDLHYS